jgi:AraC family L-rhamnose operon regulatory protein RhaS
MFPVKSVSHQARRESYQFGDFLALYPHAAVTQIPLVVQVDDLWADVQGVDYFHEDFYALFVARRGRGTHVIEGMAYEVARGDVYVMGIGTTHHCHRCDNLELDAIYFTPAIFDQPSLAMLADTPGFIPLFVEEPLNRPTKGGGRWLHLTPAAHAEIATAIAELRGEWEAGTASGALVARCLFLRLLVQLARRYAVADHERVTQPSSGRERTVAAAVRFMDEHFAEPLRIEQVAASLFLSADRFTEVFAAIMGRTPRDYLRHVRVEQAKTLLTTTDAKVADVAERTGFGEPAYFAYVFRKATGLAPAAYRRLWGER